MMKVKGYVNVVVFEYPSKTRPIVVNVYWFSTKAKAQSSQRRAKRDTPRFEAGGGKVIANRVRPAYAEE
jgi:hypothetical protein